MTKTEVFGWVIIALSLLTMFLWMAFGQPAYAQGYGYGYEEDQGGVWLDPNAPVQPYERRPTPRFHQPHPVYRGSEPYYYGPVDQQPDLIIYRDGRRFTTH